MATAKPSPYVGLRPFERTDKDRFFGPRLRDRRAERPHRRQPLGPSLRRVGGGQDSLLNAGVTDELEGRYGMEVLPVPATAAGRSGGPEAPDMNVFVRNMHLN